MRIRFDRAALICASGLVCMADGGRASIKTPMIRATLRVGAETRVLKERQQRCFLISRHTCQLHAISLFVSLLLLLVLPLVFVFRTV